MKKYHPQFDTETPRRIGADRKKKKKANGKTNGSVRPPVKLSAEQQLERARIRRQTVEVLAEGTKTFDEGTKLQNKATAQSTKWQRDAVGMLGVRRPVAPFLSEEEKAMLRELTAALKENTAELRRVHGTETLVEGLIEDRSTETASGESPSPD